MLGGGGRILLQVQRFTMGPPAMPDIPEGFTPLDYQSVFLNHLGTFYSAERDGRTILGFALEARHMNWSDVAHGGVLTSLGDVAMSHQIAFRESPPLRLATISMNTDFLGAGRLGDWLEAAAQIDKITKNLAFVSGAIHAAGERIMTMSGAYRVYRDG